MRYDDEKDYIMRMIKEVVAVLISLLSSYFYVVYIRYKDSPANSYFHTGARTDNAGSCPVNRNLSQS